MFHHPLLVSPEKKKESTSYLVKLTVCVCVCVCVFASVWKTAFAWSVTECQSLFCCGLLSPGFVFETQQIINVPADMFFFLFFWGGGSLLEGCNVNETNAEK